MSRIAALARANWIMFASYRLQLVMSIGALIVTVVPLYFVAGALQPVMGPAIRDEARTAFGFILIGLATLSLISTAVTTLPSQVGAGIRTGTLEALLATPASLPALLVGLVAFDLEWAAIRTVIFVGAGWLLGAQLVGAKLLPAAAILLLLVAVHFAFGLCAAALVVAFRTAGSIPKAVLFVSGLLGGVYYPTHVIPSWLQSASALLPLTYGLRALRRVLLQGQSLAAVGADVGILALFGVMLTLVGAVALTAALRYARLQGTLAQY
ncbi:MAG TPA: ABC transporter permease [Gemmatimonadaceae bacterium]